MGHIIIRQLLCKMCLAKTSEERRLYSQAMISLDFNTVFFGGRGKVFVIAVMSHDVCHPIGCYILHLLAILYSVALTQVNLMD